MVHWHSGDIVQTGAWRDMPPVAGSSRQTLEPDPCSGPFLAPVDRSVDRSNDDNPSKREEDIVICHPDYSP